MMPSCLNCGRAFDQPRFPLGRPRKDGTQVPRRYCDSCMALPSRIGGGLEARRRAHRDYMRRTRPHLCSKCEMVATGQQLCHGCAGRIVGPLAPRAHTVGVEASGTPTT